MSPEQHHNPYSSFERYRSEIKRFMLESNSINVKNHFARVLGCRRSSLLLECNGRFHVSPIHCNSRWCEYCASLLSDKMSHYLESQLTDRQISLGCFFDDEFMYQEGTEDITDLRHFVFTMSNCPFHALPQAIDSLRKSIRRISKILQLEGSTYIWKIECTFKKTECHPHIHFLINKYVPLDRLHSIHRRQIKPFNSQIRWAHRWECSLKEITKYCTKPSSWRDVPTWAIDIIFSAFIGRRLIGCSGDLRLRPRNDSMGYECHGCLEKISMDSESEFQGVALDIMHNSKLYRETVVSNQPDDREVVSSQKVLPFIKTT